MWDWSVDEWAAALFLGIIIVDIILLVILGVKTKNDELKVTDINHPYRKLFYWIVSTLAFSSIMFMSMMINNVICGLTCMIIIGYEINRIVIYKWDEKGEEHKEWLFNIGSILLVLLVCSLLIYLRPDTREAIGDFIDTIPIDDEIIFKEATMVATPLEGYDELEVQDAMKYILVYPKWSSKEHWHTVDVIVEGVTKKDNKKFKMIFVYDKETHNVSELKVEYDDNKYDSDDSRTIFKKILEYSVANN